MEINIHIMIDSEGHLMVDISDGVPGAMAIGILEYAKNSIITGGTKQPSVEPTEETKE